MIFIYLVHILKYKLFCQTIPLGLFQNDKLLIGETVDIKRNTFFSKGRFDLHGMENRLSGDSKIQAIPKQSGKLQSQEPSFRRAAAITVKFTCASASRIFG